MNNINPSEWIVNQVELISKNNTISTIIDIASGNGRHSIYFSKKGVSVVAIDKDLKKLKLYSKFTNVISICFDLESTKFWPFNYQFDLVLVVNYLHRKHFNNILNLVKINGYQIYETFAVGNEKYGKPSNRKFLLKNNELKSLLTDNFKILDFYEGYLSKPKSSVKQRCIAKRVV